MTKLTDGKINRALVRNAIPVHKTGMACFVFSLPGFDILSAAGVLGRYPYTVWLDSADPLHPDSQSSYLGFLPIETIEATDGTVEISNLENRLSYHGDPFRAVDERLAVWRETLGYTGASAAGFCGGAMGFFGYDLARGLEHLPSQHMAQPGIPDMAIGIYDQFLAQDHRKGHLTYHVHAASMDEAEIRFRRVCATLENGRNKQPPPFSVEDDSHWEADDSRAAYHDKVCRIIEMIQAGDIFQANLSQRFHAPLPGSFDTLSHYMNLRRLNPAPFGAWLNLHTLQIASSSPERFLHIQDGHIETKPIKGTAPRQSDPAADRFHASALLNSEKDRAENVMIVDLLRNDLSKVCHPESVDIAALCALESFAGVHHLVSTVTGRLLPAYGALDALRACFPGGSITGAPKIKAMEIIDALETARRGPYCGTIGYVGFDGTMDINIAIRTLVYHNGHVSFHVGGGITAQSEPDKEYEETLQKADRIFASFEIAGPSADRDFSPARETA